MVRLSTLATAFLSVGSSVWGFQAPHTNKAVRAPTVGSTALHVGATLDILSEQTQRDYNGFLEWGTYYGLGVEPSFQIGEQFNGWGVFAGEAVQAGSRVLYVPANLRITSSAARTQEFAAIEQYVDQFICATNTNGQMNLKCQFYLFLKVLQEFEQGEQSAYYAWLSALPKKFNTALQMTNVCLDCLPPYVKYLSVQEQENYNLFVETLQSLDIPSISPQAKANSQLTIWAYNVVFTRARAAFGEAEIIPMADMLNHAAIPNVEVQYDDQGNVHVVALRDIQAGEPLYKMYGTPTNPSRFLATYGFFDTSPPATYCKLMTGKTLTPELVNLGFVHEKMVFWVENGGIADEVWDVMLYTVLEQMDPNAQQQFYNAHMQGDAQTKDYMHQQYRAQTCDALLSHVDAMLNELSMCAVKISQHDPVINENLPMISAHNDFVRETFLKVRTNLEQTRQSL